MGEVWKSTEMERNDVGHPDPKDATETVKMLMGSVRINKKKRKKMWSK